jgi:prepilin-type N-terminal cleavage/methylation domain-containing protein
MVARFTLVELMIVVAIISILGAIAIPQFAAQQQAAKRSELALNVDGIGYQLLSYRDNIYDGSGLTGPGTPDPGTLGKGKRPFVGAGTEFETLGWEPDGAVYGTYWAFLDYDSDPTEITARSDVDADGTQAMYFTSFDLDGNKISDGFTTGPDVY